MPIPRRVLADRTNANTQSKNTKKRRAEHDPLQRPLKFFKQDTPTNSQPDEPAIKTIALPIQPPPKTPDLTSFAPSRLLNQMARGHLRQHTSMKFTTRPQLTAFVSSNTLDVYKIFSSSSAFTLPTCCSYSLASKQGGRPLLAVGTETGTVELIETPKRHAWDLPTQRTTLNVTSNMIFDIKWSSDDRQLAIATADHKVYLADPTHNASIGCLQGLTGSVKVVTWDPNHRSLLSAASRKGEILIWDIRESRRESLDDAGILPCIRIQDLEKRPNGLKQARSKKLLPRSVTSLLYLPSEQHCLVSSGSSNGILKKWDTRAISSSSRDSEIVPNWQSEPLQTSDFDPTLSCGSKRSRGISGLALGEGVIYGLGCDSRIHEYPLNLTVPYPHDLKHSFADDQMRISSFYTRLTTSPCGKWLACGSADGSMFLFDRVSTHPSARQAVRLRGHDKEVGGLDWAASCIATCSDDRTIRVWHPDNSTLQECLAEPEQMQWDWRWMS